MKRLLECPSGALDNHFSVAAPRHRTCPAPYPPTTSPTPTRCWAPPRCPPPLRRSCWSCTASWPSTAAACSAMRCGEGGQLLAAALGAILLQVQPCTCRQSTVALQPHAPHPLQCRWPPPRGACSLPTTGRGTRRAGAPVTSCAWRWPTCGPCWGMRTRSAGAAAACKAWWVG